MRYGSHAPTEGPRETSRVVPPREPCSIGRRLPGGYAILGVLGEGGTSRVYLAEQLSLGRTVAIKMPYRGSSPAEARARLRVEACAMSAVRHPGSVVVYDLLEREDGMPYLVMEHLAGERLTDLLHEPVPARRVVERVVQLLQTLEEVHACGVIHRDVKLDNVMIRRAAEGRREHLTLIDYGLALVQQGKRVRGAQVRGIAYGTPGYMSPEQLEGGAVDARTDVYSAAVLLRVMLTGGLDRSASLPPRLVAAIERALEMETSRRTPTAARFAFELVEAMSLLG